MNILQAAAKEGEVSRGVVERAFISYVCYAAHAEYLRVRQPVTCPKWVLVASLLQSQGPSILE